MEPTFQIPGSATAYYNGKIGYILSKIAKLKFIGGHNVIAVVAMPETPN